MERRRNLGVDVDQLVVLDEDALVALVDLLADPVGEDGPEQRVADVGDPLLGQLADLLVDGQVVGDDVVRSHVGRDLVDGERLVLRDGNPLHVLALDALLPACHQVLQEVDRDLVVRWQVDAGVDGQEVVALALALILGSELLGSDLLLLRLVQLDLLIWVVFHCN